MKNTDDEKLFEIERNVLQVAMEELENPNNMGNALLPRYKFLVGHYRRLLNLTRKVFSISDKQGQMLQRRQLELQNLLDHADQGFLTFGEDLCVDNQYSAKCQRIFADKITGLVITMLLSDGNDDLQEFLERNIRGVFAAAPAMRLLKLKQMPTQFSIKTKKINVEWKLLHRVSDRDESVVMMILTDISEQIKAKEKIDFLSYHDKLTGLYNRAYLEEVVQSLQEVDVLPTSVIMIDMNGLKLVNDVFGHKQGDLLLIEIGKVLNDVCRQGDTIVRWGGDEFVVLLPHTNNTACLKICQRIQAACDKVDSCEISLSAAIGMATKETGYFCFAELLAVAETKMYNDKLLKSKATRIKIIEKLEGKLAKCCFENAGHLARVGQLAHDFYNELSRDNAISEGNLLRQLVRLHDIGKIAIPEEILGSDRFLSFTEWEVVKSHSEIGYRMAQSIGEQGVADLILALHERWDGTGYPCELKGEEIPFLARLFAIVDTYDIMTHERSYKEKLSAPAALRELMAQQGNQFDPDLVVKFVDFIKAKDE